MNCDVTFEKRSNMWELNKTSKMDTVMYYICIIDILFLPYIRVLHSSISMVLLPIWFLFNMNRIKFNKESKLFFILLFFIVLSFSISVLIHPQYITTNITRMVIVIYGALYYFFFSFYLKNTTVSLKKVLLAYITFGFVLSIIYYFNAKLYFQLRSIWTMSGNLIEVKNSLLIHRFTSTFSDPNNAATVFIAVLTFLFFNTKLIWIQTIYILLATGFIVITTMSSTGLILFGVTLVLIIAKIISSINFKRKIKIRRILFIIILILFVPLLLIGETNFFNSDLVQMAFERFFDNTVTSRTRLWINLLREESIVCFILYGYGGTIVVNGGAYKPHNGHLHLIYNYGIIAYMIFLYIFFRLRKRVPLRNYLFLVPFFIGFTMNVGIYEPRFMNLLALLVASYSSMESLYREDK